MKQWFSLIILSMTSLTLINCSRAIPKPGNAVMTQSAHAIIGENDLAAKNLYLTVKQTSMNMTAFMQQPLKIEFVLPNEYKLYNLHPVKTLISHGVYRYSLDFNQIERGELNLEGDHGFNISLYFMNAKQGTFYAKPNQATVPGYLTGEFALTP